MVTLHDFSVKSSDQYITNQQQQGHQLQYYWPGGILDKSVSSLNYAFSQKYPWEVTQEITQDHPYIFENKQSN